MNTTDILPLPGSISKERFMQQAREMENAYRAGGEAVLIEHIKQHYPVFFRLEDFKDVLSADVSPDIAQFIVARSYGFGSWELLMQFTEDIADENSVTAQFEQAADAIVIGNIGMLDELLNKKTSLVHTRSLRVHHATLLHYTAANGVEDFRQKTPANAVAILERLLKAGAEVDAVLADGESTTLGLTATSIHPLIAGVQMALLEILLKAGASLDGVPGGWNPLKAAIANGCPEAARFLAMRGTIAAAQLEGSLMWACEKGDNQAVETLLKQGGNLHGMEYTGLTCLHWAIAGGQLDTMRLLIQRGASLEIKNYYGGTPLNQAIWWPVNGKPVKNYIAVIELLLTTRAPIEPGTLEWVTGWGKLSAELKTELGELLRRYGVKSRNVH